MSAATNIVLPFGPAGTQTSKTASSRALSPVRHSSLSTPRMPSPRTSPAMRPQSPLSPGYKASAHFDTLQLPSPRTGQGRPGNSARRSQNHSLKLPQLPRFHPANFPSAHSSLQPTPDGVSPQPPVSPRAHQRVMSDAQRQLYAYKRDILSAARATSPSGAGKPTSPKLAPLGSPGPVTPLELEGEDGYLVAGARSSGQASTPSAELVDRLIKEEARRRQRTDHGKDRA